MTGRDAAPTRDTSLETSHAVTSGRIRTWLGEETAGEQEALDPLALTSEADLVEPDER